MTSRLIFLLIMSAINYVIVSDGGLEAHESMTLWVLENVTAVHNGVA